VAQAAPGKTMAAAMAAESTRIFMMDISPLPEGLYGYT
jgi:hypothetical protein